MNCFVPVSDRDRGKTGRASCRIGGPTVVSQPRLVKIDVQMDRCFCLMILVLLRYPKNIRKKKLALFIVHYCSDVVRGYRVPLIRKEVNDKISACHLGDFSRCQTSAHLSLSLREHGTDISRTRGHKTWAVWLLCQFLHRLNGCCDGVLFQRQRNVANSGQQGDRPGDAETS